MMSQKIILTCAICGSRNYTTSGNKQSKPDRLELNKYCKTCNAQTVHRETK